MSIEVDKKLAAVKQERDYYAAAYERVLNEKSEALDNAMQLCRERDEALAKLAASEARVATLRAALEQWTASCIEEGDLRLLMSSLSARALDAADIEFTQRYGAGLAAARAALAATPERCLAAITDPLNAQIALLRGAVDRIRIEVEMAGLTRPLMNNSIWTLAKDALAATPADALAQVREQAGREGQEQVARYERFLRALADKSKVQGKWCDQLLTLDVVEWAQETALALIDGQEAECPLCSTPLHDGPCVGDGEPHAV